MISALTVGREDTGLMNAKRKKVIIILSIGKVEGIQGLNLNRDQDRRKILGLILDLVQEKRIIRREISNHDLRKRIERSKSGSMSKSNSRSRSPSYSEGKKNKDN